MGACGVRPVIAGPGMVEGAAQQWPGVPPLAGTVASAGADHPDHVHGPSRSRLTSSAFMRAETLACGRLCVWGSRHGQDRGTSKAWSCCEGNEESVQGRSVLLITTPRGASRSWAIGRQGGWQQPAQLLCQVRGAGPHRLHVLGLVA